MRLRDVIFWTHLIAGAVIGVAVLIIAVTGVILAFEPQIVRFSERDVRLVHVPVNEKRLSLNEIAAKALENKPDAKVNMIAVQADPRASVSVGLGRDGGGLWYIDPYTGVVLGTTSGVHKFMHAVEDWHRWFALEGKLKNTGEQIKGAITIIFMGMVVSGIYLWWPKSFSWPGIRNIVLFNPQARGKARDWNWHNVIGFWSSPVLLILAMTGLILAYSWASGLLFKLTGSSRPVPDKSAGSLSFAELSPYDLNAWVAAAAKHEPDWKAMTLRMPKSGMLATLMIQEKNSPYPAARSILKLDPATAEVKSWEPLSAQARGQQWYVFARYLHTGQVYGVAGQAVAFGGAVGAILLVWTGMRMAWRRFFQK